MGLKRPGRYFQILALKVLLLRVLEDIWPMITIQLIHPALIALKRPRRHKMTLEELGRPLMN